MQKGPFLGSKRTNGKFGVPKPPKTPEMSTNKGQRNKTTNRSHEQAFLILTRKWGGKAKRAKAPTPTLSALLTKCPVLLTADSVFTKGQWLLYCKTFPVYFTIFTTLAIRLTCEHSIVGFYEFKGPKRCFPNGVFQIPHLGLRQRKAPPERQSMLKTPSFSSILVPSAPADPDKPRNTPL